MTRCFNGDQAYGRQLNGDEKSVKALTRDDIVSFYNAYYRPNNATIIVVGEVESNAIKAKLEKAFAGWKPADVPAMKDGAQTMAAKPAIYLVDKPGAAQSSVSIGQVGIERNNPDFYAVQVMNSILGGGGTAPIVHESP
jgi:zinc protease